MGLNASICRDSDLYMASRGLFCKSADEKSKQTSREDAEAKTQKKTQAILKQLDDLKRRLFEEIDDKDTSLVTSEAEDLRTSKILDEKDDENDNVDLHENVLRRIEWQELIATRRSLSVSSNKHADLVVLRKGVLKALYQMVEDSISLQQQLKSYWLQKYVILQHYEFVFFSLSFVFLFLILLCFGTMGCDDWDHRSPNPAGSDELRFFIDLKKQKKRKDKQDSESDEETVSSPSSLSTRDTESKKPQKTQKEPPHITLSSVHVSSSSSHESNQPEIAPVPSKQMEKQLLRENEELLREMQTTVDHVRSVETQVVEIGALQSQFASQVVLQAEEIDLIHQTFEESAENVKKGVENLRSASEDGSLFRTFVIVLAYCLCLGIIILHWYN